MPAAAARSPATRTTAPPAPQASAARTRPAQSNVAGPTGTPFVRLAALRSTPTSETPPSVRMALAGDSGSSLPLPVRASLERSIGVDLSAVRVFQGPRAAAAAESAGARAFAFGTNVFLGPGERSTDLGLMAHEVAHVVQQQGAATLQRMTSGAGSDPFEQEADRVAAAVVGGRAAGVAGRTWARPQFSLWGRIKGAARRAVSAVAEVVGDIVGVALDFIRDHARAIPGYDLLGFILGRDPITGKAVDRNAANLIRAVVGFLPGGSMFLEALQKYGIVDKVGAWLDQQLATLGSLVAGIGQALSRFLGSLGASDVLNLGGVWDRAKRIFSEPVDRIIQFVRGLVAGILGFIRDAILLPIAKLAEGTSAYPLLKAVLGKDPITDEPVQQDAETLIGGFMTLIKQEEIWENMKKAKAVPRAFAWFTKAVTELKGFVQQIPSLFIKAFKSLEIMDLIVITNAFKKLVGVFGGFVVKFVSWAGNTVWTLLEIIFEVVSPKTLEYVRKTGSALKSILKNPLPFVRNLVKAAKLGFQNFADRFLDHLKAGLIDWLVGALPGVYIPKAFEMAEIVKFIFSVLGISWANIRAKLVKVLGETAVKTMETAFDIVVTLVRDGPAAAWDKIKEQLGDLKATIIGGITDLIVDAVTKKAVPKLVALFIPGAGFITAIITIYDTIKVFIEKVSKIVEVVTAFLDSIVAIAAGAIEGAATKVEKALAGALSFAISLLAGFAGLGNVAAKVRELIQKIRATVDKALDALVGWVVTMAGKLFGAVKAGVKKLVQWWKKSVPVTAGGESHTLKYQGSDRAARLALYSSPEPIPQFVKRFEHLKGSGQKIKNVNDLLPQIEAKQSKIIAADAKQEKGEADKLTEELHGLVDKLAKALEELLKAGGEEGSEQNPIPIIYPKRRASAYPAIFLGPRVGASGPRINQEWLKELYGKEDKAKQELLAKQPALKGKPEFEKWTGVITRLLPTEGENILEGVGLSAEFASLAPGKILVSPSKEGTGGGGKVNDRLRPFGFVPKIKGGEGLDGDHVMERQLGGPDELRNLWPLPASENRSSGSKVKSIAVTFKGEAGVKLEDARKARGAALYLLVRQVRED